VKLTARLLLLVLLAVLLPLRSSFALGLPGSDVPCHLAGAMQQMADDGDHAKPCHQAAGHAPRTATTAAQTQHSHKSINKTIFRKKRKTN
jgi:hypothetical protein